LDFLSKPLPDEYAEYTRFNDGACDSKGRFFAGTVYDKERGVPGQLWRYDPADRSCSVVDPGPFTVRHFCLRPWTLFNH
jgi:sugar lactone lactonase YvrE